MKTHHGQNSILLALILFLVSLCIRLMYHSYFPTVYVFPDTYSYYSVGEKILYESPKYFINEQRPFIYPLFLHINMLLTGFKDPPATSDQFYQGFYTVYFTQTIIGILGILILYFSLISFGLQPIISFLFSVFISANVLLFAWEKIPLTESISIALLIALLYFCVQMFQKPLKNTYYSLFIIFLFAFFLKPVFVALPYILIPVFIHYFHNTILPKRFIIFIFVYSGIVLFTYVYNSYFYGYSGISRNTDINLLGKILSFKLPIESAKKYSHLYDSIKKYQQQNGDPQPYRFLEDYDASIYVDPKGKFNLLKEFNTTVIGSNLGEFIVKSTMQIPGAMLDTSEFTTLFGSPHPFSPIFNALHLIYHRLQYLTLILIPAYPVVFIQYLRKKTKKYAFLLINGSICVYLVVSSVFFSYGEFGRLIVPAQPLMYVFSFYCWWKMLKKAPIF
jgi:hypothetical protein